MIIWKGRGILIVIFFGIILYLYHLIFVKDNNAKIFDSYGPAIAFLITGILNILMFGGEKKVYFDPKKNKEVTVRPDDSLFYIKVYYWSYILIALSAVCFYSLLK